MTVKVEVSYGELLDKFTILEIKLEHATDPAQRANVEKERALLCAARDAALGAGAQVAAPSDKLKAVNRRLWEIEEDIRDCERRKDAGDAFVALARSVYQENDQRAAIKREVKDWLGSPLIEEKLYQQY